MMENVNLSMSRQLIESSDNNEVIVKRPVYSQVKFDEGFEHGTRQEERTLKDRLQEACCNCKCSGPCMNKAVRRIFPFINQLKGYSIRQDFPSDIISGLTVGIMHIPQGMAYGLLAGLPPVYGLYVSFFPVFIYFLLGTSKHISVGTFAVVSLMVGAVSEKGYLRYGTPMLQNTTMMINGTDTMETGDADPVKLDFALIVTFCAGALQLLMGVCRLGFVTTYLSDPLVSGFTTAAACHVFTSQITHVFGNYGSEPRPSGPFKIIRMYEIFFQHIPETNAITLITGIASMLALHLVKECINVRFRSRMKMPIPIELLVVVVVTLISHFARLHENYGVAIVQEIPKGVPIPQAPNFAYLPDVIGDCIAIAIVSFAVSVSMAKIIGKKHDNEIDSNQELIAYGVGNVFGSFFNCFMSSASLSRSLIQENVGGKTQVAGLVSCSLLLVVLLAVGPLFRALPKCILAAIVLVNLKGMFKQTLELKTLWRVSKYDFAIWVVTWTATVFLDVDYGLGVGVLFSLLTVLWRTQTAYSCVMGRVPHTDLYRDIKVYKATHEIHGIKIFRYEASLYYANIDHFRDRLYALVEVNPRILHHKRKKALKKIEKDEKASKRSKNSLGSKAEDIDIQLDVVEDGSVVGAMDGADAMSTGVDSDTTAVHRSVPRADLDHIIIDCSTMSYLDTMGVKVLAQVISEFSDVEVTVLLAQCKAGVREMMEATEFYQSVDRGCLFLTIHDAVLEALQHRHAILDEIIRDTPHRQESEVNQVDETEESSLRSNGPTSPVMGFINEAAELTEL